MISEIVILSNQNGVQTYAHYAHYGCKRGRGFELSRFSRCTLIQISLEYSVSFIIIGSFPTTPSTNFVKSVQYDSAILFNTSASVVVLWLAATVARTNKRKLSLKNWGNQAKLNAIAEDFYFNKFVKFTISLYSRLPSSGPTIIF